MICFVLSTHLPNENYVADFSVTRGNFAFFDDIAARSEKKKKPKTLIVSDSKGRSIPPVPVGGQRKQLFVLLRQFFSATGWSVVTISTIQLLCMCVLLLNGHFC